MNKWQTFSLKSLLVITALAAVFVAWRVYRYEHQTIDVWIDAVLAQEKAHPLDYDSDISNPVIPCQIELSEEEKFALLRKSLRWLPTDERRNCVLKIVAEQFSADRAHDFFLRVIDETTDEELLRNSILLASILRRAEDIAVFEEFLDHENGAVRAAAVDGIGVVHRPSFSIPAGFDIMSRFQLLFRSDPVIDLAPLCQQVDDPEGSNKFATLSEVTPFHKNIASAKWMTWKVTVERPLSKSTKNRVKHLLQHDSDARVRSAAARMASQWNPTNYSMRLAEWGVWINEGKKLTLAQSVIDEIPPFVHRVGNDVSSIMKGRTNSLIIITKPIIHITVDQPLVVDLSVKIAGGRPWFVFPMPDDFSIKGSTGQLGVPQIQPRDVPEKMELGELDDLREGYPWLAPSHSRHYVIYPVATGFRWQTLFVAPEKPDWMKLEPVQDPQFAWWERLRDVNCSWVDNRGESERFLYYDGPTELPSPVRVRKETGHLVIDTPINNVVTEISTAHFYIEVENGKISAAKKRFEFSVNDQRIQMPTTELEFQGDQVEAQLKGLLVSYGLNSDEALGLIDCWRPQFFETDGKRLLTVFGKEEYEKLCPMQVRPEPTELSRVGIVLTELGK